MSSEDLQLVSSLLVVLKLLMVSSQLFLIGHGAATHGLPSSAQLTNFLFQGDLIFTQRRNEFIQLARCLVSSVAAICDNCQLSTVVRRSSSRFSVHVLCRCAQLLHDFKHVSR
jgi:hypothetical protein